MGKESVCIVGSGNWGSAISKIAGRNILNNPQQFEKRLPMWVFEETLDEKMGGGKLTDVINEKHENVKYLPGIALPENVVAVPDVLEAVKGATYLIFVLPHQFLGKTIEQLKGHIQPGTKGLTLIKGVDVKNDKIQIYADLIEKELGISCSSLSGANIANEVAQEKFSETTIGYRNEEEGKVWKSILDSEKFKVSLIEDVAGVSLCGALKNIVAVAAGFIDGLEWGDNAKAAIMRIGLVEMKKFGLEFFDNVKSATFLEESAGVADLMTSCMGGRNRKVAEAFARTGKSFDELEKELLGGQKLQGAATAKEINSFLKSKNRVDAYPLFKAVYEIAYEGRDVESIVTSVSKSKL